MKIGGRKVLAGVPIALIILASLAIIVVNSLSKPAQIGASQGRLHDCPESPNCVCTQTSQPEKELPPLNFKGEKVETVNLVKQTLSSFPRTTIVTETEDYLHVEFRSFFMRYVDDVEFYFDSTAKLVHFRSASRIGHSDLGVNRTRMETFSTRYNDQ